MGFLRFGAAVLSLRLSLEALAMSTSGIISRDTPPPVSQVDCLGKHYTYEKLAGYGFVPSDARDKFGDTLGGFGSSIAIKNWTKSEGVYTGLLWALPDRGWYVQIPERT